MHCRIPRVKLADPIRRSNYSATLLAFFAVIPLAVAQNAAPSISSATPAKSIAFDVVSIRHANPGSNIILSYRTTPDGYSVPGQSLFFTIMMAYFPQGGVYWSKDRLSGAPSWIDERYAIDAKVSDADLAEWQKQGITLDKKPMLRAMLQSMLADRCHLVAHMVPGPPISGWSLSLGKHAPRLTESKPGETLPTGSPLSEGGVYVPWTDKRELSYFGVTMSGLAQHLSMMIGQPVQDHTGLTGRYDIVANWIDEPDSKLPAGAINSDDSDPLSHWDFDAFGLHITPIKIPADNLVIDHIDKPSEN